MLARTEGNSVRAFTLGSQGCLSTSWPSCSPLRSLCCCIGTRFRRRRFLHRDTSLSSTRFPWVHRTDKVCVRTFCSLDSPLRIHPFQLHPTSRTVPNPVRLLR